ETFTIKGYSPSKKRWIMIYHAGLGLAGYYVLSGEAPDVVEIRLRPAATFVGRVVDANGQPIGLASINGSVAEPGVDGLSHDGVGAIPRNVEGGSIQTDEEGRFKLRGVIPGLKYTATAGFPTAPNGRIVIFTGAIAEPGETKDLGDLVPIPLKLDTK
ncbi:MAG TPA: carboxypeptidase-like regulatory domain-containing protein, partial [Planctomycetaceae bacterium]|nr:carboxypeptidase-like regulatory domain-containing protein [Planctomycetaceae bacterium]